MLFTHRRNVVVVGLCLLGLAGSLGIQEAYAGDTKHIVLIAGPKSHGLGEHEYAKSVRLIKALLDRAPNVKGIETEAYFDGWPNDPRALDRASTIIILSDGEDGTGPTTFHAPFMTDERMAVMARQMKRGCGFMTFHFSTFSSAKYAPQILEWTGGFFDWQSGHGEGGFFGVENDEPHQRWPSAIRVLDAEVELGAPDRPIFRGVCPFHLKDEFYYRLRYRENDSRLTPILRVPVLATNPNEQIVAWAVERADGGRGFAASNGHYFGNWRNEDYRRLILNAVVWTAGLEVPKGGVISSYVPEDVPEMTVVTATRAPQPALVLPVSIDVVDRERIQQG